MTTERCTPLPDDAGPRLRSARERRARTPAMFYLQPIGRSSWDLPLDVEFDAVFAPEATTGDGWVIIRFRTVEFQDLHPPHDWTRGVAQLAKTPITDDEAARLWVDVSTREMTP